MVDGGDELGVVGFGLIPVGLGPGGEGNIKGIGAAAVAGDARRIAGTGVGTGEDGTTGPSVEVE